MSAEPDTPATDLIRWTFTPDASRRDAVAAHLRDLGLDVQAREDGLVVATWDEPDGDPDALVDELWALHGSPFEITHEEFRRTDLLIYHHEDEPADQAA